MKFLFIAHFLVAVRCDVKSTDWFGYPLVGTVQSVFQAKTNLKTGSQFGYIDEIWWCYGNNQVGFEQNIKNQCDAKDIQQFDIGAKRSTFDEKTQCDKLVLTFGDCITWVQPITYSPNSGVNHYINDIKYKTKNGLSGDITGQSDFPGTAATAGAISDFGKGNCLVGFSTETYPNTNYLSRIQFHYTTGFLSTKCPTTSSSSSSSAVGGLIGAIVGFCFVAAIISIFCTACCDVKIPDFIKNSCWYRYGCCCLCDWEEKHNNRQDRSKAYEETNHEQIEVTTTKTTTTIVQQPVMIQQPPMMVQQPPMMVQPPPQMVAIDINGDGIPDQYVPMQQAPQMVQQPPMMVQQQPQMAYQQQVYQQQQQY